MCLATGRAAVAVALQQVDPTDKRLPSFSQVGSRQTTLRKFKHFNDA